MQNLAFVHLNPDWNADPNAPYPTVQENGSWVDLRFDLNPFAYDAYFQQVGCLTFTNCSVWRLGATNDEGWYRGQCRYSKLAPQWGEFYELVGDDAVALAPEDWCIPALKGDGNRHFLFYLRDETFECFADGWSFRRGESAT